MYTIRGGFEMYHALRVIAEIFLVFQSSVNDIFVTVHDLIQGFVFLVEDAHISK